MEFAPSNRACPRSLWPTADGCITRSNVDSRQFNNPAQEGTFMVRILCGTLIVALAVLFVAPAVALAADETVSGTIQSVDTRKGQITLKSEEGQTVQLQAPAALLAGLETGDAVEVKVS